MERPLPTHPTEVDPLIALTLFITIDFNDVVNDNDAVKAEETEALPDLLLFKSMMAEVKGLLAYLPGCQEDLANLASDPLLPLDKRAEVRLLEAKLTKLRDTLLDTIARCTIQRFAGQRAKKMKTVVASAKSSCIN